MSKRLFRLATVLGGIAVVASCDSRLSTAPITGGSGSNTIAGPTALSSGTL